MLMKEKIVFDAKDWVPLLGKKLPTIELPSEGGDWIFELLGWKKDGRRRAD